MYAKGSMVFALVHPPVRGAADAMFGRDLPWYGWYLRVLPKDVTLVVCRARAARVQP